MVWTAAAGAPRSGDSRIDGSAPPRLFWSAALLPLAVAALPPAPGAGSGSAAALPVLLVLAWALWLRRRPQATLPMAARRSAIAVISLLSLRYLLWRATGTLNLGTPLAATVSLTMLAAEIALLGQGLLQLALAWFREPPVVAEADQAALRLEQRLRRDPARVPAVDVLVPCCGEPLRLLERTLRGCLALGYPRLTVWLLDDGGRPELAMLCRRLGCRYRSRGERRHAKAGNLNHVLPELSGELLAVFDADVIPQRDFLARTVGLFDDPRVALVQTPQSYMNADPVIRNLGLERWLMPDEEFFYRWIEPVRQGVGAVVCAGTSFVMRRQALLQVGGFETATPSEDLATGIRLTASGHRCVYLNEKLSAGLAPPTLEAMARQRGRWASGTLQTLRTEASPLTIAGLSPLQRLAYLEGAFHWLAVIPQLLLLLPLSYGLLGVPPLVLRDDGWLTVALPLALAQLLMVRWFSHGSRSALMPELYRWVLLAPLLGAVVGTLLGRPRRFRVTPKTTSPRSRGPSIQLLAPLLALLALQLFNLQLLLRRGPAPALPLVWSALAVLSLVAALRACWDRPGSGPEVWCQPLATSARLEQAGRCWPVQLTAISEHGVELAWPAGTHPLAGVDLHQPLRLLAAALGDPAWEIIPRRLERRHRAIRLGANWSCHAAAERLRRQRLLYQGSGRWPERQAPWEPRALLALLACLVRPLPGERWFRRSALPIRLQTQPGFTAAPGPGLRGSSAAGAAG